MRWETSQAIVFLLILTIFMLASCAKKLPQAPASVDLTGCCDDRLDTKTAKQTEKPIEARNSREVKRLIRSRDRVVLLLGADWCQNCHSAKQFWREHVWSGTTFVFFTATNEELNEFRPYFDRIGNHALPALFCFRNGQIQTGFVGLEDATSSALRYLIATKHLAIEEHKAP